MMMIGINWVFEMFLALSLIGSGSAHYESLTRSGIRCSGMYSLDVFPNDNHANISIKFPNFNQTTTDHMTVAVGFFDFKDEDALGYPIKGGDSGARKYICDDEAIKEGQCNDSERGHYLVNKEFRPTSIQTHFITFKEKDSSLVPVYYQVKTTGYYCVSVDIEKISHDPNSEPLDIEIEWINPYGRLSAIEYPNLKFYFRMLLVYLFLLVVWKITCSRYSQHGSIYHSKIESIAYFLLWEMMTQTGILESLNKPDIINWGFYVVFNAISNGYRIVYCSRNLFMISSGHYVINYPRKTSQSYIQELILLYVHLLCNGLSNPNFIPNNYKDSYYVVILYLIVFSTTAMFYKWVLNGMTRTIQQLEQNQLKLQMYQKLHLILLGGIFLHLGYFIIKLTLFINIDNSFFINNNWQIQWFLEGAYPTLSFLIIFSTILWLVRPTEHNQTYFLPELSYDKIPEQDIDLELQLLEEGNPTELTHFETDFSSNPPVTVTSK